GSANSHVSRIVEVHARSVDPNHGRALGRFLRRREDCTALCETVVGSHIDEFFRELPSCFFAVGLYAASPKKENSSQKSEHRQHRGKLTPCRQSLSNHRSLSPWGLNALLRLRAPTWGPRPTRSDLL